MNNPFDISGIVSSTENYQNSEFNELSTVPNTKKPFSFNLSQDKIKRLREFVAFRRKSPEFFHYNNSSALREAVEIMRESHPVGKRPEEVKIPLRTGRPYYLDEKKHTTSFIISDADRDYIYDFIYSHANRTEEFFGKENFFAYAMEALEKRYKKKKDD